MWDGGEAPWLLARSGVVTVRITQLPAGLIRLWCDAALAGSIEVRAQDEVLVNRRRTS